MAHFAKIKNNVVEQVIVIDNKNCGNVDFPESEPIGQKYIQSIGLDGEWLQTSYNSNFRKNYASYGYTYDKELDAFLPQKIFKSWVLNMETYTWEPPIPYPNDGKRYKWDESIKNWKIYDIPLLSNNEEYYTIEPPTKLP